MVSYAREEYNRDAYSIPYFNDPTNFKLDLWKRYVIQGLVYSRSP